LRKVFPEGSIASLRRTTDRTREYRPLIAA
jgi:hypothetical protein